MEVRDAAIKGWKGLGRDCGMSPGKVDFASNRFVWLRMGELALALRRRWRRRRRRRQQQRLAESLCPLRCLWPPVFLFGGWIGFRAFVVDA